MKRIIVKHSCKHWNELKLARGNYKWWRNKLLRRLLNSLKFSELLHIKTMRCIALKSKERRLNFYEKLERTIFVVTRLVLITHS